MCSVFVCWCSGDCLALAIVGHECERRLCCCCVIVYELVI